MQLKNGNIAIREWNFIFRKDLPRKNKEPEASFLSDDGNRL